MIVTRDQAAHQARQGVESWALSDAGGLTQFGVHMQRLAPGARASERHWHSAEDELLFVLSGTATVLQDGGATALGPGGAALWRHGDPDAHCVGNAGAEPLEYLIVGSRAAHDVCTYPKSGQRQVNEDRNWRVEDAAGAVLRGGALPAESMNLSPAWGAAFDPVLGNRSISVNVRTLENGTYKPMPPEEADPSDESSYPFTFDLRITQRFEATDPLALNVRPAP